MEGAMSKDAIIALVSSFLGGFGMTWLRGYKWCNEGVTYVVALLGGTVVTMMLGAVTSMDWMLGIMAHTLTIFGAIHVGGGLANMRAATNMPAAVLPKFNELSQ